MPGSTMRHLRILCRRFDGLLWPQRQWLVRLADPEASDFHLPRPLKRKQIRDLFCLADRHGVLPVVCANLRTVLERRGWGACVATPMDAIVLQQSLEAARDILVERSGLSLLLRTQLDDIAQAIARRGLRVVVMKGPQFADRLYRQGSLRLFTDIDLLVSLADLSEVQEAIGELGYSPAPVRMKYDQGYAEQTWRRQQAPGGPIELHWDLVNSPTLRKGVSVGIDDLMFEPDRQGTPLATPTPASLLLMAAVHAAASHSFDRLQMLCDVLQIVRGSAGKVDEHFLGESARRTGAAPAVAMALDLCWRIFGSQACDDLRRRCELPRPAFWQRALISSGVVLRAHKPLDSPRRQIFRSMLKHGRPAQL